MPPSCCLKQGDGILITHLLADMQGEYARDL